MTPSDPGSTMTEDAVLVRGLRSSDQDALRTLMATHWEPLVGFASRFLSGSGDAEDTVQTAFVRLWDRRFELSEEGSLRSLLYTIVRNASLDQLRKDKRRKKAQKAASPPSPLRTPYEDVQGAELQRLAARAVGRLPEKRREVFRLVREDGLSYQEVAEVMGLSSQTVANHMSLAMADLRTALKPHFSDRPDLTRNSAAAGLKREQADG